MQKMRSRDARWGVLLFITTLMVAAVVLLPQGPVYNHAHNDRAIEVAVASSDCGACNDTNTVSKIAFECQATGSCGQLMVDATAAYLLACDSIHHALRRTSIGLRWCSQPADHPPKTNRNTANSIG